MSLENEDQNNSPDKASDLSHESHKQPKISYTRDFLLSLSELDICKNLPRGFDRSILSEFEDALHVTQDRQRIPGNLPLQGFRRSDYGSSPPTRGDSSNYSLGIYGRWDNRSSGQSDKDSDTHSDWDSGNLPLQGFRRSDYGSSPPTRGDSSNYSRGIYGRWDNRSSGQSDKDSDTHFDWDSDSRRRYGNQPRRSWQGPEHDGLLGSGSFPKPSAYTAGMSAPNVRADDQHQLNRSNEPYHPPRPYKAVPHLRRETTDSFNDETFGSTECKSQDRAEEERRRRVSFELMRKEQHKMLQEKQKLNLDKHKYDFLSDVTVSLDQTKEEKRSLEQNNELVGPGTLPVSNNDPGNSSFPSQTLAPRPLVPPGFTNTILEKNSGPKSIIHTREKEVGKPELEESLLHAKSNPVQNGTLDNQEERQSMHEMCLSEQQPDDKSFHVAFLNNSKKIATSSSGLEVSKKQRALDDHLYRTSRLKEAHDALDKSEIIELTTKKATGDKIVGDSKQDNSTSILEKLFGSALTVNTGGSSGFIEHHDSKSDDFWSLNTIHSSKFAHLFLEDEKKPAKDLSSGRPSDLLSLIVGGEKGGPQISDIKATQNNPPELPYQSSELTNRLTSSIPFATTGISEQLYNCNKQEAVPSVLTCEDLEQTVLSEYSKKSSILQLPVQDWSVSGAKTMQPKAKIDNQASQHLLSLLQKGTDLIDVGLSPNIDIGSSDKLHASEVVNIGTLLDKPREANAENIPDSGKTVTLETLFGSAFMKELQSVEAPVSVNRAPAGSARTDVFYPPGLSFPSINDGIFPSTVDEIGLNKRNHESSVLAPSQKQQTKLDKIDNWLRFDDPQIEVDSSKLRTIGVPNDGGFDGEVEIQLPEEESLITVADPVNPHKSMFMPAGNSTEGDFLSSNTQIDIAEKAAALNMGFKDERSMVGLESPPFVRGSYDLMEGKRQYHPPQMSRGRPLSHPLDSHSAHINPQMKFIAPESIIQRDSPPNNQFPASMLRPPFHHSNTGVGGFDLPSHHKMLQHRQMPGNFPPTRHLLHEFPMGAPLLHHPSNQTASFMREPIPIQGFPFGQRPNVGGLGMPLPAPDVSSGTNHREALQRLIGMELRANSKQIHPHSVGHSQGMYGHELDMGFRYR